MKSILEYLKDLKAIILNPGPVLGRKMEKREWIYSFCLILFLVFLIMYISTPQFLKSAAEHFPNTQVEGLKSTPLARVLVSLSWVFVVLLQLTIVAFLLYVFFGVGGAKGNYVNFFSLTVNAAIIGTAIPSLINGLFLLLNIGGTIDEYTHLGVVFSFLPRTGFLIKALAQFEFFTLWFMVAVILGVVHYSKLSLKRCIFIGVSYFIFRSAIISFFSYFLDKVIK